MSVEESATPAAVVPADVEARRELLDEAALRYDARHDGPLEVVAAYRAADGNDHEVAINRHDELEWRVLDISATGQAALVERLAGFDDRREQARALAADYGAQCAAHALGVRADPPILRPQQMQMLPAGSRRRRGDPPRRPL